MGSRLERFEHLWFVRRFGLLFGTGPDHGLPLGCGSPELPRPGRRCIADSPR